MCVRNLKNVVRQLSFEGVGVLREIVAVSKSSLSLWLRTVRLTTAQRKRLVDKKRTSGRRGAEKLRAMRLERVRRIMEEAEREALARLRQRDLLWAIGVALYWAEGSKPKPWRTKDRFEFTNMDPAMLLLVRKWLMKYCRVHPSDFTYAVCIHRGADIGAAQRFWSRRLGIPQVSLRTYFKRPNPFTRRHNSGVGYYGTIRMSVRRSV
ncbi:MAG: hypothetical protein ACRDGN_09735, partial [bacterium]